jgi:hypothetical protein
VVRAAVGIRRRRGLELARIFAAYPVGELEGVSVGVGEAEDARDPEVSDDPVADAGLNEVGSEPVKRIGVSDVQGEMIDAAAFEHRAPRRRRDLRELKRVEGGATPDRDQSVAAGAFGLWNGKFDDLRGPEDLLVELRSPLKVTRQKRDVIYPP